MLLIWDIGAKKADVKPKDGEADVGLISCETEQGTAYLREGTLRPTIPYAAGLALNEWVRQVGTKPDMTDTFHIAGGIALTGKGFDAAGSEVLVDVRGPAVVSSGLFHDVFPSRIQE